MSKNGGPWRPQNDLFEGWGWAVPIFLVYRKCQKTIIHLVKSYGEKYVGKNSSYTDSTQEPKTVRENFGELAVHCDHHILSYSWNTTRSYNSSRHDTRAAICCHMLPYVAICCHMLPYVAICRHSCNHYTLW